MGLVGVPLYYQGLSPIYLVFIFGCMAWLGWVRVRISGIVFVTKEDVVCASQHVQKV